MITRIKNQFDCWIATLLVQQIKRPTVQQSLTVLLLLVATGTARAQLLPDRSFKEPDSSNEYALYGMAGMSSLIYKMDKGTANIGLGYGAGLEYTFNFGSTFGISAGLEYLNFAGSFVRAIMNETYDAIDDNGTHFQYKYSMEKYEEKQTLSIVSLPVILRIKFPVGRNTHIFLGGGVKFGLPVGSTVSIAARNIHSSGYYAYEDIQYIDDLPQHGFYNGLNVQNEKSGIKGFTTMTILSFEAGLRLGSRQNALYLGAYIDYLPTDGGRLRNKHPMNYDGALTYESILNSAMTSELKMMNIGLKLKYSIF